MYLYLLYVDFCSLVYSTFNSEDEIRIDLESLEINTIYIQFKERCRNHNKAFNNERYRTDTELSKEVWAVKNKNVTPKISWSIFGRFPPYNLESMRCYLCLNEKLEIAIHKEDNLLNRRCEVISKCRHQNKYKLSNLTPFSCNDNIT